MNPNQNPQQAPINNLSDPNQPQPLATYSHPVMPSIATETPNMVPAQTMPNIAYEPLQPSTHNLGQFNFYAYESDHGLKSMRPSIRAVATILPGLIIVTDRETNQELYRLSLSRDTKTSFIVMGASISYMNGSKISYKDHKYAFYFTRGGSLLSMFKSLQKYLEFKKAIETSVATLA